MWEHIHQSFYYFQQRNIFLCYFETIFCERRKVIHVLKKRIFVGKYLLVFLRNDEKGKFGLVFLLIFNVIFTLILSFKSLLEHSGKVCKNVIVALQLRQIHCLTRTQQNTKTAINYKDIDRSTKLIFDHINILIIPL